MSFFKKHWLPVVFIIVFSFSLHLFFLIEKIPFLFSGGDPLDQFAKYQLFLHTNYRDFNFEWSWLSGLGGDLIGQFNYYYSTSLFFLLKLFWTMDSFREFANISLLISIFKAFVASIFFYFYMTTSGRSRIASLIGVVIYIGSIKFMQFSFFSDFMSDAFVFLPLVVWGLDRLLADQKPYLFIGATFLMIQSNFYFAYITTIYIGIYTCIYLVTLKRTHTTRTIVKKGMTVACSYGVGMLLASYSFLPAVYQFLQAYRFSKEHPIPTLYSAQFYLDMPVGLFMKISMITIPAVAILILLAAIQFRKSIPTVHLWMVLVFFIFYQIPYMYSVFNGFSAMQSRWTYLLLFAVAVVVTYTVDEWRKGKNIHPLIFVLYIGYLLYSLFGRGALTSLLQYDNGWLIISLHIILPLLFYVWKKQRQWALVSMLSLLLVLVSLQHSNFFLDLIKNPNTYRSTITKKMASYDDNEEMKEIVQWIQNNDPNFSRTVTYSPYENQLKRFHKHNNSMLNGLPSLSYYQSLLPNELGKFIYEDFNIKQFDSFSHFYNVDERLFLETYLQANYMIVHQEFGYVPDGYSLVHSTEKHHIYELDFPMPFAYLQSKSVQTGDFENLSVGEREMLLLQAYRSDHVTTSDPLSTYDLPTVLYEALWPFQEDERFVEKENILQLTAETTFTIPLKEIPIQQSQLLASFSIKEINGQAFTIKIGNSLMEKRSEDHIYALPLQQFAMHIDEDLQTDALTLTLPAGSYRLSNLRIEMLSFEQLPTYQQIAQDNAFDMTMMHKNKVHLSGLAQTSGMLVTSIPYSKGWQVTVDGKKRVPEQINEAFLGVLLHEGNQEVEFIYQSPFLRFGLGLSMLTFFFISIFFLRSLKEQLK